jgi:hypothetical protein
MTIGDKVVHAVRQQQTLIQFKGSLPRPMTLQRLGVKPHQFPLIQGVLFKTHDPKRQTEAAAGRWPLIQGAFFKTHDTPGRLPRSSICYPLIQGVLSKTHDGHIRCNSTPATFDFQEA